MGGTTKKIGRNGKMGLDMYLTGDKFKRTEFAKDSNVKSYAMRMDVFWRLIRFLSMNISVIARD